MSLYGKGNWTRFAINTGDWTSWEALFEDGRTVFLSSAFAARTALLANAELETSCGINPPCWPCGDAPFPLEQPVLDRKIHPWISRNLADESNSEPWHLPESIIDETNVCLEGERYWGDREERFRLLNSTAKVIGFWVVLHRREVLDDLNALREHSAATVNGKPFKTLSSSLRTEITKSLESDGLVDYVSRCQCPVILDFESGNVWLGSTSKKLVDAFLFWMSRYLKISPQPMELMLGGNPKWPQLALEAFLAQDIYKLEREEALETALKGSEEDAEFDIGDTVDESLPDVFKKEEKEEFKLDNLAVYSADNVKFATVGMDASLYPLLRQYTTVATKDAVDALAILKSMEGSSLGSAKVTFKDNIVDGMAKFTVDMSSALVAATYKGLELNYNMDAALELERLELPKPLFEESPDSALEVNRYWFRYYLQLIDAEQLIINVCAAALDLDPSLIAPKARGIVESEVTTPAESTVVQAAVQKFVKGMKKNLRPGESVTLTSGGMSATIEAGVKV